MLSSLRGGGDKGTEDLWAGLGTLRFSFPKNLKGRVPEGTEKGKKPKNGFLQMFPSTGNSGSFPSLKEVQGLCRALCPSRIVDSREPRKGSGGERRGQNELESGGTGSLSRGRGICPRKGLLTAEACSLPAPQL